jgi:hypothetical protein
VKNSCHKKGLMMWLAGWFSVQAEKIRPVIRQALVLAG